MNDFDRGTISGNKSYFQFNFIKLTFYLFVLFVIIFAVYSVVPLIGAIMIAFIISYIINPLITFFERKQIPRVLGVLLIFILIIILFVFLVIAVRKYFPSQEEIAGLKLKMINNMEELKISLMARYDFIDWDIVFEKIVKRVDSESSLTEKLPALVSSMAGMFSLLIIIPFCIFFFLLNGREMKKGLLNFIPNQYFEMTLRTISEVDSIFGNYIRGTLIESSVIGLISSIGFYVIGFPLSTSLITGMIAGLANAIPYLGPLIGLILGYAIIVLNLIPESFVSVFGLSASIVGVTIVVAIAQTLDNIIIKPYVIGKSVNLHPLLVILGVMAGSSLFGVVGMLVAIPVIAIIKVVVTTLYKQLKGFHLLSDNTFSIVSKSVYYSDEIK